MAVKETHTFSWLSCSIHPSIPSFGQPTSASLRSLNTKKSCQSYFLVIVQPSSRSNPPSIFCSSGTFPVLPKIKRSLVAPQGECVCFEFVKSKAGHVDTHMCLRVAPTLIIFKGLTSRVCDIASHQHHPTPPSFPTRLLLLFLLRGIFLSVRLSPSLTSLGEHLTGRGEK